MLLFAAMFSSHDMLPNSGCNVKADWLKTGDQMNQGVW